MTRVVVIPQDDGACGRYRLRWPAGILARDTGWDIEIHKPGSIQTAMRGDELVGIKGLPDPKSIDLLVTQRCHSPGALALLRWASSQGIAVVVDNDDAMWCLDRDNTAYAAWGNGQWKFADAAAEIADVTTVTTSLLAKRYGKHGRTEIIPNYVPAEALKNRQPVRHLFDAQLTVGWAGSVGTHPHDLEVVGDAIKRFQLATGAKVRVVGDAEGAAKVWGVNVDKVDFQPLGTPYYSALTSIDIAVVPLADTTFNRGKSWLKAMEFAMMGVPVVASPTPANQQLSRTVGEQWVSLASTPKEWYSKLINASIAVNFRRIAEQESAMDERVVTMLTMERNAGRWEEAWKRALNRAAKRRLSMLTTR